MTDLLETLVEIYRESCEKNENTEELEKNLSKEIVQLVDFEIFYSMKVKYISNVVKHIVLSLEVAKKLINNVRKVWADDVIYLLLSLNCGNLTCKQSYELFDLFPRINILTKLDLSNTTELIKDDMTEKFDQELKHFVRSKIPHLDTSVIPEWQIEHIAMVKGYQNFKPVTEKKEPSSEDDDIFKLIEKDSFEEIYHLITLYPKKVCEKGRDGVFTPLLYAAKCGKYHICALLIAKYSNIHECTSNGDMAINLASQYGHLDIVKLLLTFNANVHNRGSSNMTPLSIADKECHKEIHNFLLKYTEDCSQVTLQQ